MGQLTCLGPHHRTSRTLTASVLRMAIAGGTGAAWSCWQDAVTLVTNVGSPDAVKAKALLGTSP
jgi:hypothetical protein